MILVFTASLLSGLLLASFVLHRKPKNKLKGKHVVISGASSGIGLHLARIAAKDGAKVTIIARDENRLKAAFTSLESENTRYVSVDLSSNVEMIKERLQPALDEHGDVDILINCAGGAVSRYVEDTTEEMFHQMMSMNFYSAVNLTKALLGSLEKRCRETGSASVVFTSSVAGLMGIFGYSAYSPSKFALVGFAQTLKAEKEHIGLHVMVAFPPDTDTAGFANENIGKPEETIAISKMGGLQKPSAVAASMLGDVLKKRICSSFGFNGQLLCTAASGLWPVDSFWKLVSEIALIAPGRILGAYLHWAFKRCASHARNINKKN